MSPPIIIDQRMMPAPWSFWERVTHALQDGKRVHLRPGVSGGFVLLRNGPALLATDNFGMPLGTYADAGAAIDAWNALRGRR